MSVWCAILLLFVAVANAAISPPKSCIHDVDCTPGFCANNMCMPPQAEGVQCDRSAMCATRRCDATGVCTLQLQTAGGSCKKDNDCKQHTRNRMYCDEQRCINAREKGEACTSDRMCQSRRCNDDGLCVQLYRGLASWIFITIAAAIILVLFLCMLLFCCCCRTRA